MLVRGAMLHYPVLAHHAAVEKLAATGPVDLFGQLENKIDEGWFVELFKLGACVFRSHKCLKHITCQLVSSVS